MIVTDATALKVEKATWSSWSPPFIVPGYMLSVPQPTVDHLDSYRCPHLPAFTLLAFLSTV